MRLYPPITTSSPCARSRARQHRPGFRHLRRRRRKFSTSPVKAGVCSNKRSGSRTQGFVVHFALCPCSASSARLSSTIFTTGCPESAPAACAYILQPVARPVQREAGEPPLRGDLPCRGAGRQIIIQPACRGRRQLNRNRGTRLGLAARSAATQACICASSSGLLAAVASARRQWIIRRIGGGGGPAMKIARGGNDCPISAEPRITLSL